YNAFAGVYFITKPQENVVGVSNKPCQLMGYIYDSSNCGNGKSLFQKCPNGNTYKFCKCDLSLYPYTVSNCTETGKVLGGKVCDNTYYETCKCEDKYQYDTTNCSSPKTLSGNSCGGKYEKCTCPSTYSQTCSGNLIGVGTSCDGKYQSCKCNSNFQKCTYGAAMGAVTCTDSQGKKYDNCKAANNDCNVTSLNCFYGCSTTNSCGKCTKCGCETITGLPTYHKTYDCWCNSEINETYMYTTWYVIRPIDAEVRDKNTGAVLKSYKTTETHGGVYDTESQCLAEKCEPYVGEDWRFMGNISSIVTSNCY
ncbi:MAG: hypothetical protein PHE89_00005, partial [Alphaproteobacteria bacterium]|nr:hypothetical protein [Alphaproteobacteria bacterium]